MRLFTRLEEVLPRHFLNPVVTLGVFDGVHRGHQAILGDVRRLSRDLGGEGVVITFDPHPETVLRGAPPPTILSLPHRLLLLQRMGTQNCIVFPFDDLFSTMSANTFLREILVDRMAIAGLVMGPDNRFGKGGEGNIDLARAVAGEAGFQVVETAPVIVDDAPISSTRVRQVIRDGDLEKATAMLGRPITFLGHVVRGDGRGHRIGFPTANLDLEGELLPPNGVYLGTTAFQRRVLRSLVNIGVRPTFDGHKRVVEVHILNFNADLYGLSLEVVLHRRLRDEMRFSRVEDLVNQLHRDREMALAGRAPRPAQ